jgi:hypothetical protein
MSLTKWPVSVDKSTHSFRAAPSLRNKTSVNTGFFFACFGWGGLDSPYFSLFPVIGRDLIDGGLSDRVPRSSSDHSESGSGMASGFARSGSHVISRALGQVRKFSPDLCAGWSPAMHFPEPLHKILNSRI